MSVETLEAIDSILFRDNAASSVGPRVLLLTVPEAAKALAISDRTLWSLTKRGNLPVVRIGRSVRYDPRDLSRWIERSKTIAN